MTQILARGPVMADVHAYRLSDEEKQRLLDPPIATINGPSINYIIKV